MWGSNKIKSSKIETLIGQSIEITGDVNFDGGLHLDGKIIGNVSSEQGTSSVLVISDKLLCLNVTTRLMVMPASS